MFILIIEYGKLTEKILWYAQSKGKSEPVKKGNELLETSLRVLQEQEDELEEARQEKEKTERENRQLRHQMENLCSDLGVDRCAAIYLLITSVFVDSK